MKFKIIIIFLIYFWHLNLLADEFVNIKFLKKNNIDVEFYFDLNYILLIKENKKIKLFLDQPFILSDNLIIKTDNVPLIENENIFITQQTFDILQDIFNTKKNKEKIVSLTKLDKKQKEEIKIKEIGRTLNSINKEGKTTQKIVVIDPGHGGNDPGAIGKITRIEEKEIVLKIAKKVATKLKNNSDLKIYLTREDDSFISLKDRAKYANNLKANLFVSLHCNSSPNRNAKGTRTYIYSRIASSKDAEEAAKFENKDVRFFEFLLNDLKKSAYEYLSVEAAGYIQHSLAKILKFKWHPTERAPFYVLANTEMPSVLVEVAFISNPEEERKLSYDYFISMIADGISEGILEYFDKVK